MSTHVAVRVDDPELADGHVEGVRDLADLDAGPHELLAQAVRVGRPAVGRHRLARRIDRLVGEREHQTRPGGVRLVRRRVTNAQTSRPSSWWLFLGERPRSS
jgi:hypothetical protein